MAYFWASKSMDDLRGGAKAKLDVYRILSENGFISSNLKICEKVPQINRILELMRLLALPRTTDVVFQFPNYNRFNKFASFLTSLRHRVLFVVHDVDSIRDVPNHQSLSILKRSHGCIVSGNLWRTAEMQALDLRVQPLECWDYLTSAPATGEWSPAGKVLYAGSLSADKAAWLYDDRRQLPLYLAGVNYDLSRKLEADVFLGPFSSDCPSFPADVSWGVVWDGDSPFELAGKAGHYQWFNQPHKFSMYIAIGLPIICCKAAAMAQVVEKYGVGLCVDSLDDVPAAIAAVQQDPDAADQIRANVHALRARIVAGDFLRCALLRFDLLLPDADRQGIPQRLDPSRAAP
ncbi:MAG: beta,6-galactofuranosyltransferase [Microvirga sp.]|jgi:hypothetical protein|nr:beta,6-galactofuranosyltransferase [Microvirga sp.]